MKSIVACLLAGCIGFILSSCKKSETDDPPVTPNDTVFETLSGKVQKGPFITGTTVILNELNSSLGQTGKSFTTTIQTDDGGFAWSQIELNAGPALFTANGFYFNELFGVLSSAPVSLQALADLRGSQGANVNVLTHLIKERILVLADSGATFETAKQQAQQEILAFFGISLPVGQCDFEQGDIGQSNDLDAVLLAVSVVLQRYTPNVMQWPSLPAELTQLLATMSYDFQQDGLITNQSVKDTILHNISMANLVTVRENLEKRYADIGVQASIPAFEPWVAVIQKHLSGTIHTGYSYPDMASPYFEYQSDTASWVLNLLNLNSFEFYTMRDYSVAAMVPFDSSLTVKVVLHAGSYAYTPVLHGWEMVEHTSAGLTIRSVLCNELITMPLGFSMPGSATIEFYLNEETIPYRVKEISFQ